MELHVFVEMDDEGSVRFRNSGPNEEGASSIQIAFTTITRPMIAENTISLAMTRSPNLEELGLAPLERRRLEQLGVRNAAQLQRLGSSAGTAAISRLSGVSLDRLRNALQLGRPRVTDVSPEPPAPPVTPPPRPDTPDGGTSGPFRPPIGRPPRDLPGPRVRDDIFVQPGRVEFQPPAFTPAPSATDRPLTRLPITPDATRLRLSGSNLIGADGPPVVRLNNRLLSISQADDSELVVDLGSGREEGTLEIELPTGEVLAYELSVEPATQPAEAPYDEAPPHSDADAPDDADPWSPGGGAQ
jgi:hypothetical protein